MGRKLRIVGVLLLGLVGIAGLVPLLGAGDAAIDRDDVLTRHDLWRVIHWVCRPAAAIGLAFPCAEVADLPGGRAGYALLPITAGHVLTVATNRISGIESPELALPDAPNYWQPAWRARRLLAYGLSRRLDRTEVGLAINSAHGRSQDQLHIHTACIRRDVAEILARERDRIGPTWAPLATPIGGVGYGALRILGDDLAETDVFRLLPAEVRADPAAMARRTLVVVGARFEGDRPGFVVLTSRSGPNGNATGELLLDFSCRRDGALPPIETD